MEAENAIEPVHRSPSERLYGAVRARILRGDFAPGAALKPRELADAEGVSLAVAREALLRLVGEGMAVRLHNRGFAVPPMDADRWQQIAEARTVTEPAMLRMSIARGDVEWEVRVRAAHYRLSRTPVRAGNDQYYSDDWAEAHRQFHRSLLEGCGNEVLLDTFDRTWVASELSRRWSGAVRLRDAVGQHAALEAAVLARDADRAAELLTRHLSQTAENLLVDHDVHHDDVARLT
ncbi:GntR family transcriptional regulator [Promicromonospora sp. NPDC052451]|uniref:GntR family transcriptional regulator n=1 Tax=Promicromonospora sp. NPDC052451 TaxID=3364407 RepID=UPI0037C647A8